MSSIIPFTGAALVGTTIAVAFVLWARWLGGTYGAPRLIRTVGFVPGVLWLAFFATSYVAMRRTLDAAFAQATSAADRQRILANGIAEATWNFALSMAVIVLSAIAMLLLTWRYRWSRKLPKPEGQPPYR